MPVPRALSHLPNALSLARLFLVPIIIAAILRGEWAWAFWLFAAAGLSDALDGLAARILRARTLLGSWLDPLADKVLLVSIYVTFSLTGDLPMWLVVLVVLRDITILLYALADIVAGRLPGNPILISKINTALQIFLAALILSRQGLGWGSDMLTEAFINAVALTTAASGAAYLFAASAPGRAR